MILALALLAQPAIAPAATTDRRIEVAPGRSLLLPCAGSGPATVLFDAGGSDWSLVWTGVQQQLARSVEACACACDRAGLGQSDPAPGPRTPSVIASDLHALIGKAGFNRPSCWSATRLAASTSS
jgi:hypothetical protein